MALIAGRLGRSTVAEVKLDPTGGTKHMSAYVVTPTPEEWAVLAPLLRKLGEGGVLVPPAMKARAAEQGLEFPRWLEDYDFGGDPDVWLDVVYHDEHMAWEAAFGDGEEDEDWEEED